MTVGRVGYAAVGTSRPWAALAWLVIGAMFVFHLATLRDGVSWAGSGADLGLSVIHGLNLLEGRNFFDTSGYLSIRMLDGGAPHTYPAGYSLLQATIFALAGADYYFIAAKLVGLVALGAIFFFLGKLVVQRDGYAVALLSVGLFAAAPVIFEMKEHISSDIPFTALLFILFWYKTRLDDLPDTGWRDRATHLHAAALAVLLFLLIAVRSVGLATLPALLLLDLVRKRRLRWTSMEAVAGAVVLYLLQGQIIGYVEEGYSSDFPEGAGSLFGVVLNNIQHYFWMMREFLSFAPQSLDPASMVVFAVSIVMFAIGFVTSVIRGPRLHDAFLLCYFGVVLAHNTGSAWARYLIPVMPIFFYYVVVGLQVTGARLVPRHALLPAAGYAAVVAVMYLTVYVGWVSFGTITTGPKSEDYAAIQQEIRAQTPPDAVVMSHMHYWTHLLTGRKAARTPERGLPDDQWQQAMRDYVARAGVDFVMIRDADRQRTGFYGVERWDYTDSDRVRRWIIESPDFEEVARHGPYRLYRKRA